MAKRNIIVRGLIAAANFVFYPLVQAFKALRSFTDRPVSNGLRLLFLGGGAAIGVFLVGPAVAPYIAGLGLGAAGASLFAAIVAAWVLSGVFGLVANYFGEKYKTKVSADAEVVTEALPAVAPHDKRRGFEFKKVLSAEQRLWLAGKGYNPRQLGAINACIAMLEQSPELTTRMAARELAIAELKQNGLSYKAASLLRTMECAGLPVFKTALGLTLTRRQKEWALTPQEEVSLGARGYGQDHFHTINACLEALEDDQERTGLNKHEAVIKDLREQGVTPGVIGALRSINRGDLVKQAQAFGGLPVATVSSYASAGGAMEEQSRIYGGSSLAGKKKRQYFPNPLPPKGAEFQTVDLSGQKAVVRDTGPIPDENLPEGHAVVIHEGGRKEVASVGVTPSPSPSPSTSTSSTSASDASHEEDEDADGEGTQPPRPLSG